MHTPSTTSGSGHPARIPPGRRGWPARRVHARGSLARAAGSASGQGEVACSRTTGLKERKEEHHPEYSAIGKTHWAAEPSPGQETLRWDLWPLGPRWVLGTPQLTPSPGDC